MSEAQSEVRLEQVRCETRHSGPDGEFVPRRDSRIVREGAHEEGLTRAIFRADTVSSRYRDPGSTCDSLNGLNQPDRNPSRL